MYAGGQVPYLHCSGVDVDGRGALVPRVSMMMTDGTLGVKKRGV